MDKNKSKLSEPKPETRLQKTMRGVLRWVLVGLLAFAAGALLITFTLYIPSWQKLDISTADLEQANSTITAKNDQLSTFQMDNDTLQKNLDATTLHMYVFEALSGVRGASLDVTAADYAGARLSLIQASEALDILPGLLGTDQKDILADMQQSAAYALDDVQNELTSAQPYLEQLTKNLVQLEANLFPNPLGEQALQILHRPIGQFQKR